MAHGVVASGELVRLRLISVADAPLLDEWDRSPEARGEFNDFEQPALSHRVIAELDGFVDEHHGMLIVEVRADGAPAGTVSWRPVLYGPPPKSQAWQIGISLVPSGRGRGYGREALRLLADYLFETTDVHRLEGQTDVENRAAQQTLEHAGFVREGVARSSQWRHGAYHDLAIYSRIRGG